MHELSIASAVLNTALRHAGERPVEVVAMRVGRLRQVVADSLCFYWAIVARDTLCEGSRLEVTDVGVRLRCDDCAHEWEPLIPAFRCPACDSGEAAIIAGEELEIDYLQVREPAHA